MTFDFKKELKEFYMPKNKPEILTVPKANYIAVRGKGNPNEEGGEYRQAVGILYAVAYTLKMSCKSDYRIEGFFRYVVPPLEGFWWQDGVDGCDYSIKAEFNWISVIRLPDFVTKKDFEWAVENASEKKKLDCSKAEFLEIDEGLCVQIMHHGPFDDEPATVAIMDKFLEDNGYCNDFSDGRLHHEIYMSDARKVAPEKWMTVIRHPICKKGSVKKMSKALVIIDIQNDITKNYRNIIDKINKSVEWAQGEEMYIVYIKHNNITAGTRTFKPDTRGEQLVPELSVVSDYIFVKNKANALTSVNFSNFITDKEIDEFYVCGADATACVKSTCYNMVKAGYRVHVLSDCVTSYDLRKIDEMLEYYEKKGCEVKPLVEYVDE